MSLIRCYLASLVLLASGMAQSAEAIFAGGCFWCLEADFDKLPGVEQTISGFDGGRIKNPSYKEVSSGKTLYTESVKVIYDPNIVSYQDLLDYFWRHIDPTAENAQKPFFSLF